MRSSERWYDGRNNNGYDYYFKSAGLLLEKQGIYGGRGCLSIFHLKLPDIICIIPVSYTHLDVYKRQGYTLQIVGQKGVDPASASLILSLESSISVLAGWLLLGQKMTGREILGCVLMFLAIVLAQAPDVILSRKNGGR